MAVRDRLPVSIAGRRYEVEVEGITFAPLNNVAQVQDTQADPSELSIENDGFWLRSGEDWSLGSGQEYFDLRTDRRPSVRERFRWSRGWDVFTERRQLSLLPATSVATSITTASVGAIHRKGDRLYAFNDDQIIYSDVSDPTGWNVGSDSFAVGGLKGPHSIAVDGGVMYVADGTQVLDDTAGTGNFTTQFSAETTDYLIGGAGRLLGLHDNDLWEFAADGTKRSVGGSPGNLFSHVFAGFAFKGGLTTNNGIYVFGDDGTRSEIYFLAPVDATTELPPPYIAHNDFEEGEFVRAMRSFGGIIVIVTSLGLHLATVANNGVLTTGPLIDVGDISDIFFSGRFLFVTSSTIADQAGVVDDCGLYIFDLSEFTAPLVPAYATHLLSGTTGTALAVNRLNDQLVWMQTSNGANEIYVESATDKVASATLETGGLTFGVAAKVALGSVEVQFDPLEAGTSVTPLLRGRKASTTDTTTLSTEDGEGIDEMVHHLDGTDVKEEAELSITGTRGATATADVVIRRWALRGLPMLRQAVEIIVAVKLAEQVSDQRDTGATVRMDPLEEYEALQAMVQNRQIVDVEIGAQSFKARVDGLLIAPGRTSSGFAKWQDAGREDWLEGIVGVRLITLHETGATTT